MVVWMVSPDVDNDRILPSPETVQTFSRFLSGLRHCEDNDVPAPQDVSGIDTRMFSVFHQNLAVDHGVIDSHCLPDKAFGVRR